MNNSGRILWQLTLGAFAVKTVILIADPSPQLFLGDSASYLNTALTGWIPPDRSYLYGFVIRWLSLGGGSLFSLVLVQTMASSLSAGLLGWNLRRFLKTSPRLAAIVTILYALDPLQLMYERFVMAEAFSLLAAMAFFSLLLLFTDGGRNFYLVLASVAGLICVAFRISYLPPVVALSFSAPVVRFYLATGDQNDGARRPKELLQALGLVLISFASLHTGYKILTGHLAKAPPAYQYADGFSLLSSWSPVMTTADLRAVNLPDHALEGIYPLSLENRRGQRWMAGGLVAALNRVYDKPMAANAVAKRIAFHILRRDPMGVAALGLRTYFRGWRRDVIKTCIREDTGVRKIPAHFATEVLKQFHLGISDMPTRHTLTKSYFRSGSNWFRMLLLTPLLLVGTVFVCEAGFRPFLFCIAVFSVVIIMTAVGLAVDNSVRYLHPLGWTFFVFAAYWVNMLLRKIPLSGKRGLSLFVLASTGVFVFVAIHPAQAVADSSSDRKGLYVRNGVLMRQGKRYLGVGANYNTLFGRLLQNKSDTSSLTKLARLGQAGIPFVRFRASGFGAENQELYLQNRPEFFRRMDLVVRCAEQNHIGLIPSLFWRLATVSEVVKERRDQLGNPASKANQFIRQYTREIVLRYKNSPAIWGWEFGNEANLGVDLPGTTGGRARGALFSASGAAPTGGRLTSQQLRTAYATFAATVREIDPWRVIEPGTSLPRPFAWHLQRKKRGEPDTAAQGFSTLMTLTPDPMNMISVHVYERARTVFPGARSTNEVLAYLTRAAAAAHKPLFLGEFPVRNRAQTEEFLRAIETNRVPLSAFWVFDYQAQDGTMSVDFDNGRSFVLDLVARTNKVLQANR